MRRRPCIIHVRFSHGGPPPRQSPLDRTRRHYHGGSSAFRVKALCTHVRATAGIPHAGEREGVQASYIPGVETC